MEFDYFYGRGAEQFAFYQIPKILITGKKVIDEIQERMSESVREFNKKCSCK